MPADVVERSWRAMGSKAAVIVVGGPHGSADRAIARVEELEARWSRFRPASEVSRLNRAPGTPRRVSADTLQLVALAIEAHGLTGGAFDPATGGSVVAAGYDESFDRFDDRPRPVDQTAMVPSVGITAIGLDVDGGTVTVPAGMQLDFGGLGKGLAADLVVDLLVAEGAHGAMVSLGGDVRVRGESPEGDGWTVGIAAPDDPDLDLAVAALRDGAVATSSTLRRRWTTADGDPAHHIIDPFTGRPSTSSVVAATAIAADAATAEVLATTCIVAGVQRGARVVDDLGAGALAVDADGRRHVMGSFEAFLTAPFPLAAARP